MTQSSHTRSELTHLDCTLRDGGYYTNWDFSPDIVAAYLRAMAACQIDVVELGLRNAPADQFRGASYYTTDRYLRSLNIPASLRVGVMVNAAAVISDGEFAQDRLQALFPAAAADSPVDVVRVAAHRHECAAANDAAGWLTAQGYQVCVNVMQIASASAEELASIVGRFDADVVTALYFADSLGSMDAAQIEQVARAFRKHWAGAIGVHAHNNMGRALSNTLQAAEAGVTWLDSTVTGMGRGAGNAETEYLAVELAPDPSALARGLGTLDSIIRGFFGPLKAQVRWGASPAYYLAGQCGIHPTYVQRMDADERFSIEETLFALQHLADSPDRASYADQALATARSAFAVESSGDWEPSSMLKGRRVLLLAPGPGLPNYAEAIANWLRDSDDVLVLSLNTAEVIPSELITAHVACHPIRLLLDLEFHLVSPKPLITPVHSCDEHSRARLLADKPEQVRNYGLHLQANQFQFNASDGVVPSALVLPYALAVATSGQAEQILLAGFDGYPPSDPRHGESQAIFDCYLGSEGALPLLSITPTRYNIPSQAVFAL